MAGLKEIRLFLAFAGLETALATLRYSLRLGRLEAAFRRRQSAFADQPVETPGRLLEVERVESGARFIFERAGLEVVFLAPNLARLTWEPGPLPVAYAIARTDWPAVDVQLAQIDAGFCLGSHGLEIQVLSGGGLEFSTPGGKILRRSRPPEFRITPQGPAWADFAELAPDEHLYGLGEQAGRLDLRGQTRSFWNTDPAGSYDPGQDPLYMTLPVYLGLHTAGSYLVFYENSFRGDFRADPVEAAEPQTRVRFDGGALRYYWLAGEPAALLERFTELTGRPPLPPLWSLGYHQSRWGYKTAEDVRRVAAEFRAQDMPLSAIHLDIDYMRGYRVFTVDAQRFPDLKALAAELLDQGIRLVTIIDPGVKCDPDYEVFQEGQTRGLFCTLPGETDGAPLAELHAPVWPGWSAFPDFTHPEARQWWSGLYARLLEQGVAGFWHDMNEPSAFTIDARKSLPPQTVHNLEGRLGSHLEARNLYGLQMNRAAYDALVGRVANPTTSASQSNPAGRDTIPTYQPRPWIVSRSGWVSQQRYAWKWTGDVESTWEALRMTIATVIGCGLSGQPYTGPDIGGFSGSPSAELYLRWFQLSTFLPFFRTHSALNVASREPWTFGEPYTAIIRKYLRLRYRLLPYCYSLAWQASQSGTPLVRPLWWADPYDPRLWSVDDAFLLGDALLVAPFLEPGQTRRPLTLPAGDWYDFWSDTLHSGPGEVELSGDQQRDSLQRIPLLVRAGSLLPQDVDGKLEMHVYAPVQPGPPVTSLLYRDAGDGYGPHRLDRYHVRLQAGEVRIDHDHEGDWPPPEPEPPVIVHGEASGR